jgi:hypothetical protein
MIRFTDSDSMEVPMDVRTSIMRFHERELAELGGVHSHRELAVAATLEYCAAEGIHAPQWAIREGAELLIGLLKNQKSERRGRTANCITRYKQDLWDVERSEAVDDMRRLKKRVKRERKLLQEYPKGFRPDLDQWVERTGEWLRQGDFECAATSLAGRDAKASPSAMKKSHREVKRRAGAGPRPDRYYVFDRRFLHKIGLPDIIERKEGTKTFPLYDLKP